MPTADLTEEVFIVLRLASPRSAGVLNRILRDAGATLSYDVYNFDRVDKHPVWQSESFAHVELLADGKGVDPQDAADEVRLVYPMATIPSSFILTFVDLVFLLADRLAAAVLADGQVVAHDDLLAELDQITTSLMEAWGEEPGSESLAIMIEGRYADR